MVAFLCHEIEGEDCLLDTTFIEVVDQAVAERF